MPVEVLKPRSLDVTPRSAQLIIDAAGGGDATVIQTGLDQFGDDFTAWIKQGTYAAGFTETSSGVRIFIEPGTIIQAAITLSGDDCTLIIGAGADIQALITLAGDNCSLLCLNGVDLDGVLLSGACCLFDGGGWDTLSDGGTASEGISITGADCIAKNAAVQTTAGQGNALAGALSTGVRTSFVKLKVVDSDQHGISIAGGDSLVEGCVVQGADERGINVDVVGGDRVAANYVIAAGVDGIGLRSGAGGDAVNTVVSGNIVKDPAGDPIEIGADAENCVVVGNRLDGAVNDGSGTSTVADNDEEAF